MTSYFLYNQLSFQIHKRKFCNKWVLSMYISHKCVLEQSLWTSLLLDLLNTRRLFFFYLLWESRSPKIYFFKPLMLYNRSYLIVFVATYCSFLSTNISFCWKTTAPPLCHYKFFSEFFHIFCYWYQSLASWRLECLEAPASHRHAIATLLTSQASACLVQSY